MPPLVELPSSKVSLLTYIGFKSVNVIPWNICYLNSIRINWFGNQCTISGSRYVIKKKQCFKIILSVSCVPYSKHCCADGWYYLDIPIMSYVTLKKPVSASYRKFPIGWLVCHKSKSIGLGHICEIIVGNFTCKHITNRMLKPHWMTFIVQLLLVSAYWIGTQCQDHSQESWNSN
jgi:hypothetical protein